MTEITVDSIRKILEAIDAKLSKTGASVLRHNALAMAALIIKQDAEIKRLREAGAEKDKRITELGKMYRQKKKHIGNLLKKRQALTKEGI